MKKITLITASVLALSAASIAADRTDATSKSTGAGVVMASLSDTMSPALKKPDFSTSAILSVEPHSAVAGSETRLQANAGGEASDSSIRRVSGISIQPVSCEDAYWPYFPAECLERVEAAGL